jgi:type II secretory pathway pseudopilin PulG
MTSGMRRQRGATLIIALIMLVLLTLFAVSSFNTAQTNVKVVGNMQQKAEALNAAQQAIETVISTPQFIANPANAVPTPCGTANTLCTDVTGDGVADFTATLIGPDYPTGPHQPTCVTVRLIKNQELNVTNPEDLGCAAGQQSGAAGVAGAMTGDSLCANTVWEIRARAVSSSSGATATVTQGVGVRVSSDAAGTSC